MGEKTDIGDTAFTFDAESLHTETKGPLVLARNSVRRWRRFAGIPSRCRPVLLHMNEWDGRLWPTRAGLEAAVKAAQTDGDANAIGVAVLWYLGLDLTSSDWTRADLYAAVAASPRDPLGAACTYLGVHLIDQASACAVYAPPPRQG